MGGWPSFTIPILEAPEPYSGGDMTLDEYEKLPAEEKEHFANCSECGEIFDRRSRFVARADEKLTAFLELEAAVEPFSASSSS